MKTRRMDESRRQIPELKRDEGLQFYVIKRILRGCFPLEAIVIKNNLLRNTEAMFSFLRAPSEM